MKSDDTIGPSATPGDVAILYKRAKAARRNPIAEISHYYWVSQEEAEKLVKHAQREGFLKR